MKIIFSRKGFDTSSGGAPSPIISGQPCSIPIIAQGRSETTYDDLGPGETVRRILLTFRWAHTCAVVPPTYRVAGR